MGKSVTPKYRVELRSIPYVSVGPHFDGWGRLAWDCKRDGRPSNKNLRAWAHAEMDSFKPGGVNAFHGTTLNISRARIVNQFTGDIVAEYQAPMFEVV